jgi:Flp pilus assembly protein TadD
MSIQAHLGRVGPACAALVAFSLAAVARPALADDKLPAALSPYPSADQIPLCAPGSQEQAARDEAVVKAADDALAKDGFVALKDHIPALQAVLAHAPRTLNKVERCGDALIVHVTSQKESLFALSAYMIGASTAPKGVKRTITDYSPYPRAAFLIGTAYDEFGQLDQALPVLMRGLELDPTEPKLTTEAALALDHAGRFAEALALCDRTLAQNGFLEDVDKARLYRGRGFALGELHRWDEAEASYRKSLDIAPGNTTALNELQYIAEQRKGAPPAAVQLLNSDTGKPVDPHPPGPHH